jgi:GMP synthase (glutamine-hydrolysing)
VWVSTLRKKTKIIKKMRVLVITMAPFTAAETLGGFTGLLKWSLRQTEARQPQFSFKYADQLQWSEIKPCLVKGGYNDARAIFPSREQMFQQGVGAVVVSGSSTMVTDREPWSEATAEWLRSVLIGSEIPSLGVCYGHQLLSHALGGQVEFAKFGPQVGVRTVCWNQNCEDLKTDPVFSPLAKAQKDCPFFKVLSIHHQTVAKLPEGAKVFAFSPEKEPFQIVKLRNNVYSTQFHGEYPSKYCELRFDKQFFNETDLQDEWNPSGKNDTSLSSAVIARFFDYAYELHRQKMQQQQEKGTEKKAASSDFQ